MFARRAGEQRLANSAADAMGQVSERRRARERAHCQTTQGLPLCPGAFTRKHCPPPSCTLLARGPLTQGATLTWSQARNAASAAVVPEAHEPAPGPADRQCCNLAPVGANEHRYGQDLFFLLEHIRLQISGCSAHTESRYHQLTLLCQPGAGPPGKTPPQQQHPALQPVSAASGISVLRFKHINPGARGTLTYKSFWGFNF